MSNPLAEVGEAAREQFPVRAYLANVTAVNTTTGTATIDTGDGQPLTGVIYCGPAPIVGRQVVLLTFRRNAVILGGG